MANKSVTPKIGTAELASAVDHAFGDRNASALAVPSGRKFFQQAWEENPLSNAITNRMVRVDYCLRAIGAIHFLIHQDETRASLVNDDPETYAYDRIPVHVRENFALESRSFCAPQRSALKKSARTNTRSQPGRLRGVR